MKMFILVFVSCQLWQSRVVSKPVTEPTFGGNQQRVSKNNHPVTLPQRRQWGWKDRLSMKNQILQLERTAQRYAAVNVTQQTTATTTTKVILQDDCDYINYYCMRGFYTGHICARTVFQTYETFQSYCELEYVNCLEQYDMWTIAHMGTCYNVSSFSAFNYYAYAVWDNEQMEELYVMPA